MRTITVAVLMALALPAYSGEKIELLLDTEVMKPVQVKDPHIDQVIQEDEPPVYINGIECPVYKGVAVDDSHNIRYGGTGRSSEPAVWSIGQWDSRADLYPSHGSFLQSNVYKWENYFKKFQIGKNGTGHRGVTLMVRGDREYKGVWGNKSGPCFETPHPHLLFSQKVSQQSGLHPLGKMKTLSFKFSGRILKDHITEKRRAEWDKSKYTAHVKIHINIQHIRDDKDKTKGHGQQFGLSINYYDARNRDQDYQSGDFLHKPQRRYMYQVGHAELFGSNGRKKLHMGGWASTDMDILPIVKKAFKKAIDYGKTSDYVDPLISEDLSDYKIVNMNFGWEVSSLHHVEAHISDFKMTAEMK